MNKRTTKVKAMAQAQALAACRTMAVDLAKHVFQVAGEDAGGRVVYEERFRSREAFWSFVQALAPGVEILLEPGPGAQAWARAFQAAGKPVRLLPAQRVAEHRSGAKNDRNDAHALLRAGRDRSIHAVPVKSVQALSMQALHRVRSGYVRRRTAVVNQARGLLLEQGLALPQGAVMMERRLPALLEDASVALPDLLRQLLAELLAEWTHLGDRIAQLTGHLEQVARQDECTRRLMTIRGFGPIIATALVAKQSQPERFANARQFAAYFGMVPDQHSSGQTVRLGKMSRRGDGYLRSLVIEGAHAVLRQLRPDSEQPDDRRLQRWLQRHDRKAAAIRLANRNLRIAWVLLQNQDTYHRQAACPQEAAMTH
jgi:transposase